MYIAIGDVSCYDRGMAFPDIPELSDPSPPLPGPHRAPWEQLAGESDLDYSRFVQYVQEGGSVKAASLALSLSYEHTRRVAARNRWKARREAYRVEENAERRHRLRTDAEKHTHGLLEGWRACMDWAIESVAKHRAEGRYLDPRTAAQVLKSTTEALRLLDGETTSHVAVDLKGKSMDDLDALNELLEDS